MFSPSDAEIALLAILTVASYSLVGLLAIWAGLGRPQWFLRVAVVGGTLLLLLLIPAYEPLLVFSIQSAVVVLPLMLLRALRGRVQVAGPTGGSPPRLISRLRPQFSLSDLLLLTVVVAVVVAVGVKVPTDLWETWAVFRFWLDPWSFLLGAGVTRADARKAFWLLSLGFGISTLAAAWVALGRRALWLRLIVLCLIPTSAVIAGWLALVRASGWVRKAERREDYFAKAGPAGRAARPVFRRLARLAAVLLSLVILLPPVGTFCVLVAPGPERPQIVLPDPNGYDDLVKAGKAFGPAHVEGLDTATPKQLRGFVAGYGHAFDMARVGLARECRMPPVYSTVEFADSVDDVMALRDLARAFRAEGKLSELEGRPADAAESYLDAIRLGLATARGARATHWTISHALESTGIDALIGLREMLTPAQCREVIDTLQTMNANRESPQDVAARDQLYDRIGFVWYEQLEETLSAITGSKQDWRSYLGDVANQHQARLRLLICSLALRSYSVENGHPPEKLADLVPEYLSELPGDPYGGRPFVYRREAKRYVLYSVGPDGHDNGGQSHGYSQAGTDDILLDKPPEEEEE